MPPLPPEAWLRGPVPAIPDLLQPVAHSLIQADEEIGRITEDIDVESLWVRPGGAAAIGFHLAHLTGALDRLFRYARGDELDTAQREWMAAERKMHEDRPPLSDLLTEWELVKQRALAQLAATDPAQLATPRFVGRARLPSTVLGLLFHAAEHTTRHVGQMVTTHKVVTGPGLSDLIDMKRKASRPLDLIDLAALEARRDDENPDDA
ncbi:MAG: DinB family protein [Candidatus Eisenbacteria bacterium]|nr:DinB family protein [Candidatus Eisenbacteria bacterium]